MKFLVDAHISVAICVLLKEKGFDAIHTSDLPLGNDTPDNQINQFSIKEQRIVITKDNDFFHTFIVKQQPYKLLLIKTGNLRVKELKEVFELHFEQIINALKECSLVELNHTKIKIIL